MGKRRTRSQKISNGERPNVSSSNKKRTVSAADKMLRKVKAWKQGKNPWLNVNGKKVPADEYWGKPQYAYCNIYRGRSQDE